MSTIQKKRQPYTGARACRKLLVVAKFTEDDSISPLPHSFLTIEEYRNLNELQAVVEPAVARWRGKGHGSAR